MIRSTAPFKQGEDVVPSARADGTRNRTRVLSVAALVFATEGTDASLREIARRADIGIGTLYRHFPNRDALIYALVQEEFERLRAEAEVLTDAEDPRQALLDWLIDFAGASRLYPGLPQSVIAAIGDPESELHAAAAAAHVTSAKLLARAQTSGVVRTDVRIEELLALVVGIAWAHEQTPSTKNLTSRLLTLAFEGLGL
jgi:AcrR family transcriptional regulator